MPYLKRSWPTPLWNFSCPFEAKQKKCLNLISFKLTSVQTTNTTSQKYLQKAWQQKERVSNEEQRVDEPGLTSRSEEKRTKERKGEDRRGEDRRREVYGVSGQTAGMRSLRAASGSAGLVQAHGSAQPAGEVHLLHLRTFDKCVALWKANKEKALRSASSTADNY